MKFLFRQNMVQCLGQLVNLDWLHGMCVEYTCGPETLQYYVSNIQEAGETMKRGRDFAFPQKQTTW
jgi:hypothetical protein